MTLKIPAEKLWFTDQFASLSVKKNGFFAIVQKNTGNKSCGKSYLYGEEELVAGCLSAGAKTRLWLHFSCVYLDKNIVWNIAKCKM